MNARLVVVSGLPASGKTTVGRALSERLRMPLIDKDAILEALFDSLGCPDRIARYRLSRASDEVLFTLAEASPAAVVVNWWDHGSAPARLRAIGSTIVEVFCDCPVDIAAARFEGRARHPGHHDAGRSREEIAESLRHLGDVVRGPLGVGEVVRVDTAGPVDAGLVAEQVLSLMRAQPSQPSPGAPPRPG